jgi:hypothetical protein
MISDGVLLPYLKVKLQVSSFLESRIQNRDKIAPAPDLLPFSERTNLLTSRSPVDVGRQNPRNACPYRIETIIRFFFRMLSVQLSLTPLVLTSASVPRPPASLIAQ